MDYQEIYKLFSDYGSLAVKQTSERGKAIVTIGTVSFPIPVDTVFGICMECEKIGKFLEEHVCEGKRIQYIYSGNDSATLKAISE